VSIGRQASHVAGALAAAEPRVFWLDNARRPALRPPLRSGTSADLAIVGGGYSGLWTAVLAKEREPDRTVLLVEGDRLASAATGRNGGFCSASLTHGEANGRLRFPEEAGTLERLGRENLDDIETWVTANRVHCAFRRTGMISVATEPHHVEWLREGPGEFLDQQAMRAEVNSPTYLAGSWEHGTTAMIDPAALAWSLAGVAEAAGVRIVENTRVSRIDRDGTGVRLTTERGVTVRARRVALGTNAFPSLVRRVRLFTVPVYDYVLVTEPLSAMHLDAIRWRNGAGVSDLTNQFHYYRMTTDNRILWGGYDAVYHFGHKVKPAYDQRPATFEKLAQHFFRAFPQLEGLRFTHRWGGAIDTCTRFFAFYGTALGGRVAYALGYTGLGVGASRFGANVMLDLLAGQATQRTELQMVRRKPLPFPPEPLAFAGIQATRWSLAQADRNAGRRNLWLRGLDRLGLGFDS
jgi:glycine/D-amino acid oxidase-like deaminating enzyme